jgi:hypothetical protein
VEVRVANGDYHEQQSRPEFSKRTIMLMNSTDVQDRQHHHGYSEWIADKREPFSDGFELQLGLRAKASAGTSEVAGH